MKTKFLTYVLAGSLIAMAALLVHGPKQAQADVPEKYKDTVRKGLEYLVKQQHADGHWEGDGGQHPVAMTGLVGLTLVMEKNNPNVGGGRQPLVVAKYAAQFRKAADWLAAIAQGERDGLIFSGHASETTRYMEGHGLAIIFLAGALEDEQSTERRNKLNHFLTRAVKYTVKAQSSRGGWYHTSKVEGHDFDDPLVTVIQMQALMAAGAAGIAVAPERINDAAAYLNARLAKPEKEKQARLTETAAALAVNRGLTPFSGQPNKGPCEEWLKLCAAEIPRDKAMQFGRDELAHYYYAQALFQCRGEVWNSYRAAMFDHLQSTQKPDGSWPAASGLGVGPIYATALWCTLLQLDRRSHPSTRWGDQVEVE
jgi:hypothetical protein